MIDKTSASRLSRKEAQGMDELVRLWLKSMNLVSPLNEQRIFAAWDKVTGAGGYTLSRYYKKGVLYCSISSSVVRSQLYFQKDRIVQAMNECLSKDEFFAPDDPKTGFVKSLVLK